MSLLHWLLIICRKLAIQTNPQRRFQQVYEETLILYFPLDLNVVRALWSLNLNLRTMSYVVERSEDKYEQAKLYMTLYQLESSTSNHQDVVNSE